MPTTTSTVEYEALILDLKLALKHNIRSLLSCGDSNIMIDQQLTGEAHVNSPVLRPLHFRASQLLSRFSSYNILHVYRNHSLQQEADKFTNKYINDHFSTFQEQQQHAYVRSAQQLAFSS